MSDEQLMNDETTEPKIFIQVQRYVNGKEIYSRKQINLMLYMGAKFPGALVASEINAALCEIGWKAV